MEREVTRSGDQPHRDTAAVCTRIAGECGVTRSNNQLGSTGPVTGPRPSPKEVKYADPASQPCDVAGGGAAVTQVVRR